MDIAEVLLEHYLLIKALHVIAIISWMAGLLYLPRLFVYHTSAEKGSKMDTTFQTMERRLIKFIMTPAGIVSSILGLMLLMSQGMESMGKWFHAKAFLILILITLHILMIKYSKDFAQGRNVRSARYFKIFNELPTLCMIAIVILVIIQPF